jgi:hypothetical protein
MHQVQSTACAEFQLVTRKSTRVEAGLCEEHIGRRRRDIAIAWLIALTAVASFAFAIFAGSDPRLGRTSIAPITAISGFVLLIVSVIWGAVRTRPLVAKKMTDNYAWLAGAGADYLNTLPAFGQ